MTRDKHPCLFAFVKPERAEQLSDLLVALGASALEERDEATMTGSAQKGSVQIIAGFDDETARSGAVESLVAEGVEALAVDIGDDGWSAGWRAFFRPVVLDKLQIVTPWMPPPRPDLETIVIDPGLAFGTGGHATTRLVLRLLEERSSRVGLPSEVLDVGTGSGVLAIAAVKLGARRAVGVDIDEESVVATRENAVVNGVGSAVEARLGGPGDVDGTWALVLANIELSVFLACAADVAKRVAVGGELIVSGLLSEHVAPCEALFPGFTTTARLDEEGWAALAMRRSE